MASRNHPGRHRKVLERRAEHLAARIENYQGHSSSYDRAELAATKWALAQADELEALKARLEQHGDHTPQPSQPEAGAQ